MLTRFSNLAKYNLRLEFREKISKKSKMQKVQNLEDNRNRALGSGLKLPQPLRPHHGGVDQQPVSNWRYPWLLHSSAASGLQEVPKAPAKRQLVQQVGDSMYQRLLQ